MSVDQPGEPYVSSQPPAREPSPTPAGDAVAPTTGAALAGPDTYPARFQASQPIPRNKGLVLLRCFYVPFLNFASFFALLPHVLILIILYIGLLVTWIISWFTVLLSGQIPRGIFDFEVGVLRWTFRLQAWQFLLTDTYPAFSFDEEAHPVRFSVEYPEGGIPRWRGIPLLSAILTIPVMIVAEIVLLVSWLLMILPPLIPGVIPLLALFGSQGVPEGMYNFVRGGIKLASRAQAYALMLVRPYPTFDMR